MSLFLDYLKLAFSDNGQPSSSRLLAGLAMLSVLIGFLYVCFHSGQLPDGAASAGAGTLAIAPYGVNRLSKMFGKDKDSEPELNAVPLPHLT